MASTETEVVQRIRLRVQVRLLQRRRGLLLQVRPRISHELVGDRRAQGRARLDAEVPAQVARLLPRAAAADVGRQPDRDRLREHLLLHPPTEKQAEPGRICPPRSRTRGTSSASRRRRRSTSRASARSTSRGRLPQAPGGPREAGRALPRHGLGLREHEDIVKQYFGTIIPQNDNKFAALNSGGLVGRLVHLRAPGVASRCRSRPTSASTPRTWASSSAR